MKIRAGELRERIELVGEKPARDPDFGGEIGTGAVIDTVWAKFVQAASGTTEAARQLSGTTGIAFYIRFREDLTTGMSVRFRGALLPISAIAEVEFREFLLLTCQVRDGGAA